MAVIFASARLVRGLAIAAMGVGVSLLGACGDEGEKGKVEGATWHQDVAPIVTKKCSGCHHEGGIAPFSIESYDAAKQWAGQIAAAVESGSMPPFLAQDTDQCQPRQPWKNDIRLSDAEKAAIRAWADNDAPEGDADTAAPLEPPPPVALDREDVLVQIPNTVTIEGTKDIHACIVVDPQFTEDVYVIGRLLHAGNPRVLHHVVSYVIQPGTNADGTPRDKAQLEAALIAEKGAGIGGQWDCFAGPGLSTVPFEMLDAWAPGGLPNRAPPDAGQPVAKDSLVLLDVHYHPNGLVETDSETRLALMLAPEKPAYVARTVLIGNFEGAPRDTRMGIGELLLQEGETTPEFKIPAGAANHVEEMTWTWKPELPYELRVIGMGTHMHYVGRDMLVQLEHAPNPEKSQEADTECLIQTPAWDFNWQRGYSFDAPYEQLPVMRAGDVLRFRCVFDNSMENPHVAQALRDQGLEEPVEVLLGEDTLDEMCLGAISIMYPSP